MLRTIIWTLLAVGVGVLIALQTRLNGNLATTLGDPFVAAPILFGSGLVILLVVGLTSKARRDAIPSVVRAVREHRLSWWQVIGGVGGAALVYGQTFAAPVLGVALFMVALVAGQTIGGLVMDGLGIGPAGRQPASFTRVAGAVLVVVAVLVSVAGHLDAHFPVLLLAVPFACGVLVSYQQAVNGRVGAATSSFAGTIGNFVVGSAVLGLVLLVHALTTGLELHFEATRWHYYVGGVIGVIMIGFSVLAVAHLGVLRLSLTLVTGQLLGSFALDLLRPVPGSAVTVWTGVGLALALAAVALSSVRRGSRPVSAPAVEPPQSVVMSARDGAR